MTRAMAVGRMDVEDTNKPMVEKFMKEFNLSVDILKRRDPSAQS